MYIGGVEALLDRLPNGNWVGGTIPYFTLAEGGRFDDQGVFIADFTPYCQSVLVKTYSSETLDQLPVDSFEHGFRFLVLPAGKTVQLDFALKAPQWDNLYESALAGIVAGVPLDEIGKTDSKTYNGSTGESYTELAVCLHVALKPQFIARMEISNIFEVDKLGPVFEVAESGFEFEDVFINDQKTNLARFLGERQISPERPLVADYAGQQVNAAFKIMDPESGKSAFYGPLFKGEKYYLAKHIDDYQQSIASALQTVSANHNPTFACTCILNYLFGKLEGHKISVPAPTAFGEVAYIMLSQTFTYLIIEENTAVEA